MRHFASPILKIILLGCLWCKLNEIFIFLRIVMKWHFFLSGGSLTEMILGAGKIAQDGCMCFIVLVSRLNRQQQYQHFLLNSAVYFWPFKLFVSLWKNSLYNIKVTCTERRHRKYFKMVFELIMSSYWSDTTSPPETLVEMKDWGDQLGLFS